MIDTFAIIWDMDGVLVDTVTLNWIGRRQVLALHDIGISDQEITTLEGQPLEDHFNYFVQAKGLAISYEEFKVEYIKLSRVLYEAWPPQTQSSLIPLLDELRKCGVSMGVGTSSSRARAERLLEAAGLTSYFSVLIAKEDVAEHKPDPAVFLEAASQLGALPENCVVVEDAANGIQAARAGGMKSIGIINMFHTANELHHADMVIEDFDELNYKQVAALSRA